jgi:hypothetical protein
VSSHTYAHLSVLACGLALLACSLAAGNGSGDGRTTFVAAQRIEERGTATLYGERRDGRLCLKLVRRFRKAGRQRSDSWTSCGLPRPRAKRLVVRRRIACATREMQLMGLAPARTARLHGRLDDGRRITLRAYRAPAPLRTRARLFMRAHRGAEIVSLRAVDANGRKLASVRLAQYRGPSPCA